jgi:hypothetical protein
MKCTNCGLWELPLSITGYSYEYSETSLVLLIGVNDKLIIIKHSKIPKCSTCGYKLYTFYTTTPEIKVTTGNVVIVPINIFKLPVYIGLNHQIYTIYDVPRFGKLIHATPSLKVLYLPANNITGEGNDDLFWVDSKLARCFMTYKDKHIIIVNECGEVFWPEVLTPLGGHMFKYEMPAFTLEFDENLLKWEFTPNQALHTKPAIKN